MEAAPNVGPLAIPAELTDVTVTPQASAGLKAFAAQFAKGGWQSVMATAFADVPNAVQQSLNQLRELARPVDVRPTWSGIPGRGGSQQFFSPLETFEDTIPLKATITNTTAAANLEPLQIEAMIKRVGESDLAETGVRDQFTQGAKSLTSSLAGFSWPDMPDWTWPDLPPFSWPDYVPWKWPPIPQPDWLNRLVVPRPAWLGGTYRVEIRNWSFVRKPSQRQVRLRGRLLRAEKDKRVHRRWRVARPSMSMRR